MRNTPSNRVSVTTAFRCLLLPGLLLLVGFATTARADVFLRLGRGTLALEQLGGLLLQRADVRINGQPGKLAVYGFEADAATLAPDLRKALPLPELQTADASLATHVADGRATSLLLLPGSGPRNCLAILIEQSADAWRKSREAPVAWPGGLACPGATPTFTAENEQTRTALIVADSLDSPETAAARMDAVLSAAGWTSLLPKAATPGLVLYTHSNRVCAFSAIAGEAPGSRTRITVLQRNGTAP